MEANNVSSFTDGSRGASSGRWIAVLILLAGTFFLVSRDAKPPAGWGSDYAVALAQAHTDGRRLLVAFHMQGCPPCRAMDRDVLGESAVQLAMAPFIPVRLDVQDVPELANRLGVFATPTYAVLEPDETMVMRTDGFQPVEVFVRFLNRAARLPPPARP